MNHNSNSFPNVRLRRLRRTASIRSLTDMAIPTIQQFIWPVFIVEGINIKQPIEALPGQYYFSIDTLLIELEPLAKQGLGGLLIFAVIDDTLRTPNGEYAWSSAGLLQRAVAEIKQYFPELTLFADVGLSAYTSHGNNGIFNQKETGIDNDTTLEVLGKVASSLALKGADGVAPCAMMDGQVGHIREKLDQAGFDQTLVMGYSAKFHSGLYDTFPPLLGRSMTGPSSIQDCCPLMPTYCTSGDNLNLALREVMLDELEGADILMIKPATFYLDVIAEVRRKHLLPLAAYNVSGEYSMIHATAEKGWGRLYPLARESLMAIKRSGADILISYWANQYEKVFNEKG